jgi:hypothetical protein
MEAYSWGSIAMPAADPESPGELTRTHPQCPECALPMWLTKLEKHSSGAMKHTRLHYECKVCEAVAIVPSLDG